MKPIPEYALLPRFLEENLHELILHELIMKEVGVAELDGHGGRLQCRCARLCFRPCLSRASGPVANSEPF